MAAPKAQPLKVPLVVCQIGKAGSQRVRGERGGASGIYQIISDSDLAVLE